jgi:hypothetical protein
VRRRASRTVLPFLVLAALGLRAMPHAPLRGLVLAGLASVAAAVTGRRSPAVLTMLVVLLAVAAVVLPPPPA